MLDRISIEPSRFCSKGCAFCYNGSSLKGREGFSAAEVVALASDCAKHGVRSISIGGGEPLEWPGLFDALERLDGVLGRSFTTNGAKLAALLDDVVRARPDKVHVSVHHPREAQRVAQQVLELDARGIAAGVNLLVRRSLLAETREAAVVLERAGISRERVVFLPSRGVPNEGPEPEEVAYVATGLRTQGPRFMSMTCLDGCAKSARFASIAADRTVAWCSYTSARMLLAGLTHAHLLAALAPPLGLISCHPETRT